MIGSLSNLLGGNKGWAQFFAGTSLILLALRLSTALSTSPLRLMVKLMTLSVRVMVTFLALVASVAVDGTYIR